MMVKGGERPTEACENGEMAKAAVCQLTALSTPWAALMTLGPGHSPPMISGSLRWGSGLRISKSPDPSRPHESFVATLKTTALNQRERPGVQALHYYIFGAVRLQKTTLEAPQVLGALRCPPCCCGAMLQGLRPLPSKDQFGTLAPGSRRLPPPATPPLLPGTVRVHIMSPEEKHRTWDGTPVRFPEGPGPGQTPRPLRASGSSRARRGDGRRARWDPRGKLNPPSHASRTVPGGQGPRALSRHGFERASPQSAHSNT